MKATASPAIQPIVMPFLLAFAYAFAVVALARDPLVDWTSVGRLKATGYVSAIALLAPVMLIGRLVWLRRQGRNDSISDIVRDFVDSRIRPGYGLPFLTPLLTAVLVATAYNVFKQRMLPASGYRYDDALAAIDLAVFGTDPWRLTHALVSSPTATWVIDQLYHPWFLPMTFGIAVCTFMPLDSTARLRHTLGFALLLIVPTTIVAWLVPAVGPCFEAFYHGNPRFDPLMATLREQQAWSIAHGQGPYASLAAQTKLAGLLGAPTIADGGGIAALPSLHNSMSTLFICFAVSLRRRLIWVLLPYTAVILFGSVHLGWHYAIDGVAGIGMAIMIWFATGPMARANIAEYLRRMPGRARAIA